MSKRRHRIVRKPASYQPTRAEMEEDVSIKATPQQLARAAIQPVEVAHPDPAGGRVGAEATARG